MHIERQVPVEGMAMKITVSEATKEDNNKYVVKLELDTEAYVMYNEESMKKMLEDVFEDLYELRTYEDV